MLSLGGHMLRFSRSVPSWCCSTENVVPSVPRRRPPLQPGEQHHHVTEAQP
jgi:hypothetical protein